MNREITHVVCSHCGWVHFSVSLAYAEEQIQAFDRYYQTLSQQAQSEYYGNKKATLKEYTDCNLCGQSGLTARLATQKEINQVAGCTLGPLVMEPK